jgi:hypothetical protein
MCPVNPRVTIPAPTGFDQTNDSSSLPLTVARSLVNFLADRQNVIRGLVANVSVLTPTSIPDGGSYYYGANQLTGTGIFGTSQNILQPNAAGDRLLLLIAGTLYSYAYASLPASAGTQYQPTYPPVFQGPQTVSGSFVAGQRIRTCQFQNEMVICQTGNTYLNYRYFIASNTTSASVPPGTVSELGLPTPSGMTAVLHTPSAPPPAKTGVIQYSITLYDNLGRESSPQIPFITLDFVANPTKNALLSFGPGGYPSDIGGVNFYATIDGGSTLYQIDTQSYPGGAHTFTWEDGATDAIVQTGKVGPNIGENDAPNPASICCIHKDHLLLNDLTNPVQLQISNQGSITQFNSQGANPINPIPTDGLRLIVGTDQGDIVTGIASLGSYAIISKRKSMYLLYGSSQTDFQIVPIETAAGKGCVAPDSFIRVDDSIFFLSADGVYSLQGSTPTKISKPIEAALQAFMTNTTGEANYYAAVAGYAQREYTLAISPSIFVYNLDTQAWRMDAFGLTA